MCFILSIWQMGVLIEKYNCLKKPLSSPSYTGYVIYGGFHPGQRMSSKKFSYFFYGMAYISLSLSVYNQVVCINIGQRDVLIIFVQDLHLWHLSKSTMNLAKFL